MSSTPSTAHRRDFCRALCAVMQLNDARPRSRPYRLSCPSRPKITRDPRDEKDKSEVADKLRCRADK